ncbi:hypothetical protein PSECIP111951_02847 [Pseudoalteromonas holothuriae]|uniref:Pullulanase n=1 Tax=Pseudoalteromonas holothuriae TaxID=2963714 RepID=A0ABM9GKG6_9GAMM|nr:hypothetical protein [Pseudoalteromonas sp. CIP111951]CAH9063159.1 hypothetical protein PSECIP111951_02847 [Pseudoalteromonas sp. CIP111951]
MKKHIMAVLSVLCLSACSSQVSVKSGSRSEAINAGTLDRTMYLRGDFTLWDFEPHYILKEQSAGIYTVKAKFMTPGKVYEFKIADEQWSKGYNCGYKVQGALKLGQAQLADCNALYNYFTFMPNKKGWYVITFDYRDNQSPTVTINMSY